MANVVDRTGQRFGRCTVTGFNSMKIRGSDSRAVWDVLCDCGNSFTRYSHFESMRCCKNCLNIEKSSNKTTHGESYNRSGAYQSWTSMLRRCNDVSHKDYVRYGGVGITICKEWDTKQGGSYLNFLADMGQRPDGKTLNRVGGSKIYSKETCEWATLQEQVRDQKLRVSNKSGTAGVKIRKRRGGGILYEVSIYVDGKYKYIGQYEEIELAVEARKEAELLYYVM